MRIIDTPLAGVKIIEPDVFGDARGYFLESWTREKFLAHGIDADFIQDNESGSRRGVLRGLHYQSGVYAQAKLVRVISGAVWDVAVDIRRNSPTYGQHFGVELSGENHRQIFIPRGFAHGFAVLSEEVIFAYKCDNVYMPSAERGIRFDDPQLNIDWHIAPEKWILSEKDKYWPAFKDITPREEA